MNLLTHAMEKEAERAAWDIWIALYPNFTEETFTPFSQFKTAQLTTKPRATLKEWDAIKEEMAAVVEQHKARK